MRSGGRDLRWPYYSLSPLLLVSLSCAGRQALKGLFGDTDIYVLFSALQSVSMQICCFVVKETVGINSIHWGLGANGR